MHKTVISVGTRKNTSDTVDDD